MAGDILNLSGDRGESLNARIAALDGHLYVVWDTRKMFRSSSAPITEVMFTMSNDNGISFSAPKQISKNLVDSIQPNIAVDGERVYVVWAASNTNRFFNIFFRMSLDNGETFGQTVNLQNDLTHHMAPEIFVGGKTVYVTWENAGTEHGLSLILIYGNGTIFVNDVTFNTHPKSIMHPRFAVTSDRVFLAWDIEEEINFASARI